MIWRDDKLSRKNCCEIVRGNGSAEPCQGAPSAAPLRANIGLAVIARSVHFCGTVITVKEN